MRTSIVLIVAIAGLTASAGPARAKEQQPLTPFDLVARDGRAISSAALARPGKWILIYVPVECGGCESLLKLIVKDDEPLLPSRIAIVIGKAGPDAVNAAVPQFPDLVEAGWYADPAGASMRPLQVDLAPAVFGMDGNVIDWALSGVLGSSSGVKTAMRAWVTR